MFPVGQIGRQTGLAKFISVSHWSAGSVGMEVKLVLKMQLVLRRKNKILFLFYAKILYNVHTGTLNLDFQNNIKISEWNWID